MPKRLFTSDRLKVLKKDSREPKPTKKDLEVMYKPLSEKKAQARFEKDQELKESKKKGKIKK